jgi:energy-coupling factor transporter ATP-binding protein EcfA2
MAETTIYLSSTYEDLQDYRKVVFDALSKSGYRVIAMENYVASDKRPVDKCLADVESADIYVGIFGFRYGYVPSVTHNNPNKLSITELELRHAEKTGKPCLTFVVGEGAPWPNKFNDAWTDKKDRGKRISKLREYLLGEKTASFFSSPQGLAILVQAAVKKKVDEVNQSHPQTAVKKTVPSPIKEIPESYKNWVIDRCKNVDLKNLMEKGKVLQVGLPGIFIPLYTDSPDKKRAKKIERDKQAPVDIEELAARGDYLLIEGQAGSGKTTLLKHLSYTIIQKTGRPELEGYLPVLIFLRDLQSFARKHEEMSACTVTAEQILTEYLASNGITVDTVKAFCGIGKAIFLIDGLDEIDPRMREKVVDSFADFRTQHPCKMVFSGREHGIDGPATARFGERHVKIHTLNMEQVKLFITKWFECIYSAGSHLSSKTAEEMMGEIRDRPSVDKLIDNPLMLTAICILYYGDKKLPEQRAELYRKFVDNLLSRRLDNPEKAQNYLMALAFTMHQKRIKGIAKVEAVNLMGSTVYPQQKDEEMRQYWLRLEQRFDDIEQKCGLLKRESGEYQFWHLTFQEFMTARDIMNRTRDYAKAIETYWGDDWYNEVIALYIGYLSIDSKAQSNGIIADELSKPDNSPFKKWRLAARSLVDIKEAMRDGNVVKKAEECLLSLLEIEKDPKILADAGETLGWLGDPRPLEEFVRCNGGDFHFRELGKKTVEPFEIARYPVTNQWYERFILEGGYTKKEFWSDGGRKWLEGTKAVEPALWRDRKWRCPNSPVVGVTWYEACAFTKWLTKTRADGHEYRLPTEAQWEAAAAGKEGREYP